MAEPSSPVTAMAAFRSRGRWLAAATMAAGLLVAPAAPAADGDVEGILDRPIVDVALIERDGAPWPDLLTLDTSGATDGAVRVTLLRRDAAWSILDETTLDLEPAFDLTPWLVDLGAGRYAVVSRRGQGASVVLPLRVDMSSSANPLRVGATVDIENIVRAAGAADVDGDGARELVVASSVGDDPCTAEEIEVLFGDDLQQRDTFIIPERYVAGAALGEWDGRPGADLLLNAYESCPAFTEFAERHHLLAIRLRDGSTIVDIPAPENDPTYHWPSLPLVVDVDGDGRDEAIVRTDTSMSIVDPTDAWRAMTIADGDVAPLVAMPSPVGPHAALVTWIGSVVDEPSLLWVASITRDGGSLRLDGVTGTPLGGVQPDELANVLPRLHEAELTQQPALAWTSDLDGDGCPELLAPLVQAGCLGTGEIGLGPSWLGTRPLAVVGPAGDRRLLAALGLLPFPTLGSAGVPFEGGLSVPAPAAAGAIGAWRPRPAAAFALAELPLPTSATVPVTPVAAPLVDPFASADGLIDVSGPTGSRLLIRAMGLASTDPQASPGVPSTSAGFLHAEGSVVEFSGGFQIPVPSGTIPGATLGSVPFNLRAVWTPAVEPPYRWMVVAATLDGWGNVSEPVAVTAIHDVAAPNLAVDVPFLSAPWPFDATLVGTSEAGASVRAGDGPAVPADDSGAFQVRIRLAPWPQTLEVTAIDPSGNTTVTRVSVMGGLDIRQLPWPTIAAVAFLLAVLVSSMRGSRRAPTVTVLTVRPDDDHQPEIEELGESPLRRRG